jgi:hypothetical protein
MRPQRDSRVVIPVACSPDVTVHLPPAFEVHHLLYDGFALFGDGCALFGEGYAVFAELFLLTGDGYGNELVDFFPTTFADRHVRTSSRVIRGPAAGLS